MIKIFPMSSFVAFLLWGVLMFIGGFIIYNILCYIERKRNKRNWGDEMTYSHTLKGGVSKE